MVYSDRSSVEDEHPVDSQTALYFFPDQQVSETRARWILRNGSKSEKAWVVSHLLRFALWEDIWTYVSRDEVRDIFPELDLPETLAAAWAKMLKIELVTAAG